MKDNYEIVYSELVKRLRAVNLSESVSLVGGYRQDKEWSLDFLERRYVVNHEGIWRPDGKMPDVSTRIVLCHYVLQSGQGEFTGDWVSYRDFKDSAFFIGYYQVNVDQHIAKSFGGRIKELAKGAGLLGGRPYEELGSGDACYFFQTLPRMPLLLIFFDKDEDFPASSKLLFDRSAANYLDAECLAVLGSIVADRLVRTLTT